MSLLEKSQITYVAHTIFPMESASLYVSLKSWEVFREGEKGH